jgi:hypothetical protein
VVTTTTTTTTPSFLGLAAWSPPCTATAAEAPWCSSLHKDDDGITNHFDRDCLVPGGYARLNNRNTTTATNQDDDDDDDDPIPVTTADDEDDNSVGLYDFDPMQAWHSLLHYGPSSSSSTSSSSSIMSFD